MGSEERHFGYEEDFRGYARTQEERFREMTSDLSGLAIDPSSPKTEEDSAALLEAAQDILHNVREIVDVLGKNEQPLHRGDAFYFASELIEAAFTVGTRTGLSTSGLKLAHKLKQSEAAKSGAQRRAREAEAWQAWARDEMGNIRKANPNISSADLTDLLRRSWPAALGATRGHERVVDFVRKVDREAK